MNDVSVAGDVARNSLFRPHPGNLPAGKYCSEVCVKQQNAKDCVCDLVSDTSIASWTGRSSVTTTPKL